MRRPVPVAVAMDRVLRLGEAGGEAVLVEDVDLFHVARLLGCWVARLLGCEVTRLCLIEDSVAAPRLDVSVTGFPIAYAVGTACREKRVETGQPRHIEGSGGPAPSPALDHHGHRIQPGTARAGDGAGQPTEPSMVTR